MDSFLCELFDVPNIDCIEDLQSIFDTSNAILVYASLYKHPRIHYALAFRKCYYLLFGCVASKIDVFECSKQYSNIRDFMTESIAKYILNVTFAKYMKEIKVDAIIKETKHFLSQILNNDAFIKNALTAKLMNVQECEPVHGTLYKLYSSIHDTNSPQELIVEYDLLKTNAYLGTVLSSTIPDQYTTLTLSDAVSYVIARDHYFMRICYMNYCVCSFDKDTSDLITEDLISVMSSQNKDKHIIYFGDTMPPSVSCNNIYLMNSIPHITSNIALFNACVPRIFSHHITYSDHSSTKSIMNENILISRQPVKQSEYRNLVMYSKDIAPCMSPYVLPTPEVFSNKLTQLVLQHHMKYTCPLTKPVPFINNSLVFQSMLLKYIHKCDILNATPAINPSARCVMLIDNRENIMDVLSVYVTFFNLPREEPWSFVYMGSSQSIEFMKEYFPDGQKGIHYVNDSRLEKTNFHIEIYNDIMKDPLTWSTLEDLGFEKCLVIQDDGMLLKNGIHEFSDFAYVGAPWNPNNQETMMLKMHECANPSYVGNGGFSLRDIKLARKICFESEFNHDKHMLFNRNLQPMPEDAFFGRCIPKVHGKIPSFVEASRFAMEQVFNLDAIGIHKFWAYNPVTSVVQYMESL